MVNVFIAQSDPITQWSLFAMQGRKPVFCDVFLFKMISDLTFTIFFLGFHCTYNKYFLLYLRIVFSIDEKSPERKPGNFS